MKITKEQKIKLIKKFYKKMIEGSKNTPWTSIFSFTRWSLNKIRTTSDELVIINEEYPEIKYPYNLKWITKQNKQLKKKGE